MRLTNVGPLPILLAVVALAATRAAVPAPAAAAAEAHTLAVDGVELYYETAGEGEPLLLLHAGVQCGRMWDPFVERLAARYRLIVPDLRGHGGSSNPDGAFVLDRAAADILALLDHLGVERCRGMGASLGAMTLLRMAALRPERLEAVVLVGVGSHLVDGCREVLARYRVEDLSEAAWGRLRQQHRRGDDQIRALFAMLADFAAGDALTLDPDSFASITARTLLVHGDRDYCYPVALAEELYRAIPRAYLWVVPNGDHVPIRGPHAERFTGTALEFLSGSWEGR